MITASPVLPDELAEACEGYEWVGGFGRGVLEPGGTLSIGPIRLVPAVEVAPPAGGPANAADLAFRWQPYPGAEYYRVALGFDDPPPPSVWRPEDDMSDERDFWVSDKALGTELRYDLKTGHVRRDDDQRYLTLKPRIDYVFTVVALDSEGRVVSRGRSKPFRVK